MYNILQWQLQNKYFFEMLKKKKKRKKNISLTNTSGYMVYGIFKCYNFHFNNYVGFSILIKGDNRTTFVVGEHICLLCIAPTVSIAWEITPFSGISDFCCIVRISGGTAKRIQCIYQYQRWEVDPYICC